MHILITMKNNYIYSRTQQNRLYGISLQKKKQELIIFTNKQRVYLYQYVWHKFLFSIFSLFLHVILIKTTIYFRVVTKDLDFLVSGGYIIRYGKSVSKVVDIFYCNNKNQTMNFLIYTKTLEKDLDLARCFSTLLTQNCEPYNCEH